MRRERIASCFWGPRTLPMIDPTAMFGMPTFASMCPGGSDGCGRPETEVPGPGVPLYGVPALAYSCSRDYP